MSFIRRTDSSVSTSVAFVIRAMQSALFCMAGLGHLLPGADASFFVDESYFEGGHGLQVGADVLARWDREKADSVKFLAENGKKPKVITTASGLEYQVLKQGTGSQPGPEDLISVNYSGTLIDDVPFIWEFKDGPPVTYHVDQVSVGWHEAVQLMHEGDRWRVWVPSDLSRGPKGERALTEFSKFDSRMWTSVLIYDIDLRKVDHLVAATSLEH